MKKRGRPRKVFDKLDRNCPLCGAQLLRDPSGSWRDRVFCEKKIKLEGFNREKNHYVEDPFLKEATQYAFPYRLVTTLHPDVENTTKVSVFAKYSTGRTYFKTLFKCGAWIPLTEEQIVKKVKTLMVFS